MLRSTSASSCAQRNCTLKAPCSLVTARVATEAGLHLEAEGLRLVLDARQRLAEQRSARVGLDPRFLLVDGVERLLRQACGSREVAAALQASVAPSEAGRGAAAGCHAGIPRADRGAAWAACGYSEGRRGRHADIPRAGRGAVAGCHVDIPRAETNHSSGKPQFCENSTRRST